MSAAPPALAPDLVAGLRRLKLAAMRQLAPELLVTAKTQRWAPEELLTAAGFPVTKTLDEFDLSVSAVNPATFDYLANLEWITAADNLCLVGPAGTGKSHYADLRVMPT